MSKKRLPQATDYADAIRDNAHDFDCGRITVTQFNFRNDLYWREIPTFAMVEEVRALLAPVAAE
jgi:hypothetical protein